MCMDSIRKRTFSPLLSICARVVSLIGCCILTFGLGRHLYLPFDLPPSAGMFLLNGLWITAVHIIFCVLFNTAWYGVTRSFGPATIIGCFLSISSQLWAIQMQLFGSIALKLEIFPLSIYLFLFPAILTALFMRRAFKNPDSVLAFPQRLFLGGVLLYLCIMGFGWNSIENRFFRAHLYFATRALLILLATITFINQKRSVKK